MKTLTVKKPWGKFDQFTHNELSTVKIITVDPNEQLSLQSHTKRTEFWKVIGGSGEIEIDGTKHLAQKNEEYTVLANTKHRMTAGTEGLEILEIATGDFDEEDITRYEDKYGRA